MAPARRETVDLDGYPDLVVIYLGMRVNALRGLITLLGFGPKIQGAVAGEPDGLLRHETVLYSLRHVGMRQYWRDFDSLEHFSRSEPHREWWARFARDTKGTGFWHETYSIRGGIEAIYDSIEVPLGLAGFAPRRAAKGTMFSARRRLRRDHEQEQLVAPIVEEELERGAG